MSELNGIFVGMKVVYGQKHATRFGLVAERSLPYLYLGNVTRGWMDDDDDDFFFSYLIRNGRAFNPFFICAGCFPCAGLGLVVFYSSFGTGTVVPRDGGPS